MLNYFIYAALIFWACFIVFRIVRGRVRFKNLEEEFAEEGLVLSERWVFTRFNFPMIKRVTFTRVYLTRRRFFVVHCISLNMVLQAPLGAEGAAGTDKGRFEVETRGAKKRLLLRTTIRGGGKVRFHLADPELWLKEIRG